LFGVEQRARPSVNVAGCAEAGRGTGNREQGTGNRGILGAGALRGEALRLVPAAAGTAQGDPSRASGRTEGKSGVMARLGPTRASLLRRAQGRTSGVGRFATGTGRAGDALRSVYSGRGVR